MNHRCEGRRVWETGASCYNFKLKSLFDRCIISVNAYIKCIIRVNKMYHTIDIPYCSYVDIRSFPGAVDCNN